MLSVILMKNNIYRYYLIIIFNINYKSKVRDTDYEEDIVLNFD